MGKPRPRPEPQGHPSPPRSCLCVGWSCRRSLGRREAGGEGSCSLQVQSDEGRAAQRRRSLQLLPALSSMSRIGSRSPCGGATCSCGMIRVGGEDEDEDSGTAAAPGGSVEPQAHPPQEGGWREAGVFLSGPGPGRSRQGALVWSPQPEAPVCWGVHTEHHADLPLLPPPFLDEDGSAWQPTGSGTDGGSWEWGVSVPQPLGVSLSPSPCPRTKGRCLEELLGEGAQGRCLWPLDIHWPSQRAVTVSSEGS